MADSLTGGKEFTNFKDLVDTVSAETGLPAGQVRKVSLAMLEKFAARQARHRRQARRARAQVRAHGSAKAPGRQLSQNR